MWKCKIGTDRYHTQHLTQKEMAENVIARRMLNCLKDFV